MIPARDIARSSLALALAASALAGGARARSAPQAEAQAFEQRAALEWDARRVEHLFNRAAFGVAHDEATAWVARGTDATVESLLAERPLPEPFFRSRTLPSRLRAEKPRSIEEELELRKEFFRRDREQLRCYAAHWMRGMLEDEDPLRDRMTLFWVGFFTAHYEAIGRPSELVLRQHQFLRDHALASYAELLHGIVDQAATRRYLDNDTSVRGAPNENLARELMELFSLGAGNYSEEDVREAARALTGHGVGPAPEEEAAFTPADHDFGEKRILGEAGDFDAHGLVELLLRQEACARFVARRLIAYLEGRAPDEARELAYAELLRRERYELRPFLRALLLDPAFYRDEVLGRRVQGPVDYLVGSCRRLDLHPPPLFLADAAGLLGLRFWEPPSVQGWEEGSAWITTAALIDRGNATGLLLGVIDDELLAARFAGTAPAAGAGGMMAMAPPAMGMEAAANDVMSAPSTVPAGLHELALDLGPLYRPDVNLVWRIERSGARTDGEVARFLLDALLAIPPPADALAGATAALRAERERRGIAEGAFAARREDAEELLRELAHLILCLPEAQLH